MAFDSLKRLLSGSRFVSLLARSRRPRVLVLMFHDLRTEGDFANWLRVSEREFRIHLEWLRSLGRFVSPEEATHPDALPTDRPHFLLTFDDGYVNNVKLALPILEHYEVPALFFVSTHALQSQQPFWFDVVVTAIQAARLSSLDLQAYGLRSYRFRSNGDQDRWADINRVLEEIKRVGDEDHAAVEEALRFIREKYQDVLEPNLQRCRPLHRDEVARMARSRWCHIGSHSHHHRILTRQTDDDLRHELATSRRILEELCDRPVLDLAYPNGNADDRVIAAAKNSGYQRGYTTDVGTVTRHTDPMTIPRIGVDGVGPDWLLRYRVGRQLILARLAKEGR